MQDQSETVRFLADPATHGGVPVEVVETHGALVFLVGDAAYKIKRAVRYDYMDLSTLDRRHAMLARELELNRPAAPRIYRDLLAVTRGGGGLALGGPGEPVEWVLRMWRFPAADELLAVAERGALDDRLAARLGHRLQAYHRAVPRRDADGVRLIADILDELARVFADMAGTLGADRIARFDGAARAALVRLAPLLSARGASGHVRRGHGDLHLRNLVLIDGEPVPFDALEFDETLGTCDVLYDFAFLLMDLDHRGLRRAANVALAAWLLDAGGAEDAGLAALPLFLAVRAAIRAMVLVQTDAARGTPGASATEARRFLDEACAALAPSVPRLVAVGGVSGTGKTVLAAALAPLVGPPPGAIHLRSDLERKAMSGVEASRRLPEADYAAAHRADVYRRLLGRAGTILAAGWPVVLDATFLDPAERRAAVDLAARAGVGFRGLWLTAPAEVLLARVSARRGDASDADAAVVRAQLAQHPEAADWSHIDANRPLGDVVAAGSAALGLDCGGQRAPA
ncbi:AAA family ATPase [Cereibacter sphaeroides]|uniref:bifunctional aminoglycoside phosphotransferase/ATP-binding protein n=1 Tax=Cereibacter sphaeroides TaxID=1063 RepID=UPI001F429026|nr:bifunctional aminoglycoside phosphotransferase/ATP-binding protein [Cereibacter sphaeroides]MCE6958977.1 AAA family ATPase [Cereibacter sphaeroides]MCE6969041.1 AAA family ATPase [Cereibacter sphaeroides]MCE6973681.1 AAA family ATPase [Cereibacter sphaeroides]